MAGVAFQIFPLLPLASAPLTGSFQPSAPFVLADDGKTATLDFEATVTVLAKIEWYFEFTNEPPAAMISQWFREVAQDDTGNGVVKMPTVVRNFEAVGGGNLAAGTYAFTAQTVHKHVYCRIQMRAAVGTVTAFTVTSVFGLDPA